MTIMGSHTAHELSELLDNFEGFVSSVAKAYADGWHTWAYNDPAAADDWTRDWDSFRARWAKASTAAHAAVDAGKASFLGWDASTNEAAYQALLLAYKPSDGDPTSLPDLDRRWRAAGKAPPPVYVAIQPTAPDADLGAYKAADAGLKEVQAIAKAAMPSTTKLVIAAVGFAVLAGIIVKVAK